MNEYEGWYVLAGCVTGARHFDNDTVCQDAVAFDATRDTIVLAVADGHGDQKHARSDTGARIAVEVAGDIFLPLGEEIARGTARSDLLSGGMGHVSERVVWEWTSRVKSHAGIPDPDGSWDPDLKLYGTTLLVMVVANTTCVVWRVGDGDLACVDATGAPRFLLDPGEGEILTEVPSSLCMRNASTLAQARVFELEEMSPSLLLVASDGLRAARDDSAFLEVCTWLWRRLRGDPKPVFRTLLQDLDTASRYGTGDDVTLGMIGVPCRKPIPAGEVVTGETTDD